MSEIADLVALLDELGPALLSSDDRAGLVAVCETARRATDAASCSVAVLDEDAGELHYIAASGRAGDEVVGVRLPLGSGIAGFAASSGQGIAVADVRHDPRFAVEVAESIGYIPDSLLAVPITHGDDTLGVLSILDAARADLELAAGFAAIAAPALRRAALSAGLGQLVASALAERSEATTLATDLRAAADAARGPSADLADLAALFAELGSLGARDRAAATRIVAEFTSHVAGGPSGAGPRRRRR